jgi:hypothetical protein
LKVAESDWIILVLPHQKTIKLPITLPLSVWELSHVDSSHQGFRAQRNQGLNGGGVRDHVLEGGLETAIKYYLNGP